MSYDLLTTSGINSFINSYKYAEQSKLISPLNIRKSKYQSLSSAWKEVNTKLSALKTILSDFKSTGTDSIFGMKSAASSNTNFINATANMSATSGSFAMRVSQLAKSDVVVSNDLDSEIVNGISGTHSFVVKTGDGKGGEFVSNISVDLLATDTNKSITEKIQNAINKDKAIVNSSLKSSTDTFSGVGTFKVNLNGTETSIDYDYSAGMTYDEVMDDLVSKLNSNVKGITAEKVVENGNVGFKITVNDSANYISIDQTSDTGTLLSNSEMNLNVIKEKAASGMITASSFSAISGKSQLSLTAKSSGLDNRITEISDAAGSSVLTALGLNLGTSRTSFDQSTSPNTAGFLYADISQENNLLNAKFDFNGINIQRNSNSVSDLVSGVTFDLKSVMKETDSEVSVTVNNDTAGIKKKIEEFVDKFNQVYTFVKGKSTTDKVAGRGIFVSEASAGSLLSSLSQNIFKEVDGVTGDYKSLNQIGISFDPVSGLKISDSSKLEKALSENVNNVAEIFNSENGIANQLYSSMENFLGASGVITKLQSSYDSFVKDISDKVTSTNTRIDKRADVLRKQYEQMQMQLASLMSAQSLFMPIDQGYF